MIEEGFDRDAELWDPSGRMFLDRELTEPGRDADGNQLVIMCQVRAR